MVDIIQIVGWLVKINWLLNKIGIGFGKLAKEILMSNLKLIE